MSKSYDAAFENPADKEYVTRSALPNGGTLIVNLFGVREVAERFVPDAKRKLGDLQSSMSTSKVTQSSLRYDIPEFNEKVSVTEFGVTANKHLKLVGFVEINAVNGYATFPDTGKIVISITEKEDSGGWQEAECIGYIIQTFVDKWDSPYASNQRYIYRLEDPDGRTLYNDDGKLITGKDVPFAGYPDQQTKHHPVGEETGYDYVADESIISDTGVDIVFVIDRDVIRSYDFLGPITYSPGTMLVPFIPGCHANVGPGPYYATGICGTYDGSYMQTWTVSAEAAGFASVFSGVTDPYTGEWLFFEEKFVPLDNVVYICGWHLEGLGAGCQPDLPSRSDYWQGLKWWPPTVESEVAVPLADKSSAFYYKYIISSLKNSHEHYYVVNINSPNSIRPIYANREGYGFAVGAGFTNKGIEKFVFTDRMLGNGEAAFFMMPFDDDLRFSWTEEAHSWVSAMDFDTTSNYWNVGATGAYDELASPGPIQNSRINMKMNNSGENHLSTPFGVPNKVAFGLHKVKGEGGSGNCKIHLLCRFSDSHHSEMALIPLPFEVSNKCTHHIRVGKFDPAELGSVAWVTDD